MLLSLKTFSLLLFTLVGHLFFSSNFVWAQDVHERPGENDRVYQIFLVGNTGTPAVNELAPTFALLRHQLGDADEQSSILFLGDQLTATQHGLDTEQAEAQLKPIIDVVEGYAGSVYFIPGDQDYIKTDGQDHNWLLWQETYLEEALGNQSAFLPDSGKADIVDVKLKDDLRLVVLNTPFLLGADLAGNNGDLKGSESLQLYQQLQEVIRHRHGDELIIVGHHPIYSNGRYGGHFSTWPNLVIPGLQTFRNMAGNEQYFAHEHNNWMRHSLAEVLDGHEDFVYASAHDYNLQYFHHIRKANQIRSFVVSGSASRSEYVAKGHDPTFYDTRFVSKEKGFVSLHYYRDGSIWLDAWGIDKNENGRHIYATRIKKSELALESQSSSSGSSNGISFADSVKSVVPGPRYKAGLFRKAMLGRNHRNLWTREVTAPYLDMGREAGGLQAIKRGGSGQTTSIRLQGNDNRQYTLRSVNKNSRSLLPEVWTNTIAIPILQDALSYTHPYNALAIPKIAEAIGVYHTNPRLVYVPSDPRMGEFRDLVSGLLMFYEDRPNGDMSNVPHFGFSEDVVGYSDMYRAITDDNDDRVDARSYVRASLLDMWLSDWDRHEDQWRWAKFDDPDGKGSLFRPIPRDRDQAFNRVTQFMAPLVRPFFPLQDYRKFYGNKGNIKGLASQTRHQSHRFLSELTKADWLEIADSVKQNMTDEVIESAFRNWPASIYEENGEEMVEIGKIRREKLSSVAEKVYLVHARSVDVVGSNKRERFEVNRVDNNSTHVKVYKITREGNVGQELYNRVLNHKETREVNLYGLGGSDEFIITGQVNNGIRVNAVGGAAFDAFVDSSRVSGLRRKTHFYDTTDENDFILSSETKVKRSNDPGYNRYTGMYDFERAFPVFDGIYNTDDGTVLFAGFKLRKHAFKKTLFAREQSFSLAYETKASSFAFKYQGTYREAIGKWDLGLLAEIRDPNSIYNFFGLGNETLLIDGEIEEFETRLAQTFIEIPIRRDYEYGLSIGVTPTFERASLDEERTDLIGIKQPGLSVIIGDAQWYSGVRTEADLTYLDDLDNPRRGYLWENEMDMNFGIVKASNSYIHLASALTYYLSLRTKRQYTLALRAGGEHNIGSFPYYRANTLGGKTNLRGFRETRFSGRSSFYVNAELRLELLNIKSHLLPGRLGVLGFIDNGRVWTDDEDSDIWHRGSGVGAWYNIANEILLNYTYSWSEENTFVSFGLGFFL